MSAVAPFATLSTARAHVALVGLDEEVAEFLRVCLLQMGIETFPLIQHDDLSRKKFEGFFVDLRHDDAESVLAALRGSSRNQRSVIFAVYSDPGQLRKFSKFGINAVMQWPAKRAEAIKVLRSAQTLLVHELRRYARIPLASDVELTVHSERYHAISREVSGGGMSISFTTMPKIGKGEYVEVCFVLPPGRTISVKGVVCWSQESEHLLGVQFIPEADVLMPIRAWIDDYLGIN